MNQLVIVRNPFDRADREVRDLPAESQSTVEELVGEYIPAGLDVSVSINGNVLAREDWFYNLAPGDQMVVVPRVEGDGAKGIIGAVLMIAIAIYAPYLAGEAYAAMYGVGAYAAADAGLMITALQIGVTMAGPMVIG